MGWRRKCKLLVNILYCSLLYYRVNKINIHVRIEIARIWNEKVNLRVVIMDAEINRYSYLYKD